MQNDKMILFYGGPFSQWYRAEMVVNGVKYNTAEQFMMAMKAQFFGDTEAQAKIMATKDPAKQKAIGREVKGFKVDEWSKVSRRFVYAGNYAKFTQNSDLYVELMNTGDLEIVEASPYDKIWGIGLGETDPRAFDKTQWQGLNWLGECVMKVRADLRLKDALSEKAKNT